MRHRYEQDRRATPVALRWPDRRTGFDRRRRYPVSNVLRANQRCFAGILGLIFLLGVLDWALTSHALATLDAYEANPVMRFAFEAGPSHALLLKVVTLGVVVAGMWHLRRHRNVILLATVTAAAHLVLIGYHVSGAVLLG